jgi:hypothetical protein
MRKGKKQMYEMTNFKTQEKGNIKIVALLLLSVFKIFWRGESDEKNV